MNWVLCTSLLVLLAIYRKQLWHNARIKFMPGYAAKCQAEKKAELRARHERGRALERDRVNRIVQAAIEAEQARMRSKSRLALASERQRTDERIIDMVRSAMNELVQEVLPQMVQTMVVGTMKSGGHAPVPVNRNDYEGILRIKQKMNDDRDRTAADEKEAQQRLACDLLDWAKQAIHDGNPVAVRHLTESLDSFNDQLRGLEQNLSATQTYYNAHVGDDFEAVIVGSDINSCEGAIANLRREIDEVSALLNKHVFAKTE